ncbi:hypothetical protein OUZ56_021538 [Daphnia magna]|uniref:Uncharacterized protein n=1 Tax=Daphnia magna TaxID=35525 RepID=A0ABQ9ZHQ2_9CRUS|nr:hypothetical protein OUZ56_021538 [Daphnia magna]
MWPQLTEWTLTANYETNLTLEQKISEMYPPWPLPGIHCGGHFDNAHYLLNQKVYFPTWMENAANTLNANLKLWLTSILSAEATSNNNKSRPDEKCHLETIGVVWTISAAPYWPKVTAQLCHRLRPDVRDQPAVSPQGSCPQSADDHTKLGERLKNSRETRELLLRSPAPGAHPMETHLTQIQGSVL